jgi:hypothetical protein
LVVAADTANLNLLFKFGENLRELEITIGAKARPVIADVRARLSEAAALRDNGDMGAALAKIRIAMERLASLGGELDAAEGALMAAIAARFSAALDLGDKGTAKEAVNFMRRKAGDPKDDPNTEW